MTRETTRPSECFSPRDDFNGDTSGREITLMFSGGVDSTLTAMKLAGKFRMVHLVTYMNGYGHSHFKRTGRRAQELIEHFPGRFQHSLISIKDLFEHIVVNTVEEDFKEYGSGFIWCLGCKLAMHTRSILYNLEHGITWMADGSSGETDEMVEQMPVSVYLIGRFYENYGISFRTPVYHLRREESIRKLERSGLKRGIRIRDRLLGVQPKCRPGLIYYLPYLLFGQPPDHKDEEVARFIEKKIELAEDWLAERKPRISGKEK